MESFTDMRYEYRILRVDLTKRTIATELVDEQTLRKSVGGASLGIKSCMMKCPQGSNGVILGIDYSSAPDLLEERELKDQARSQQ